MGSPITFSGFNSIDFNLVLNSVMASAAQPLTALQNRQSAVQSQITNLGTLTAKVSAVQNAAAALSTASALAGFSCAVVSAVLGISQPDDRSVRQIREACCSQLHTPRTTHPLMWR